MTKDLYLYLIRHGIAETKKENDLNRHLTQEGIKMSRKKTATLPDMDMIFCSPAQRATETIDHLIGKNNTVFNWSPSLYFPQGKDYEITEELYERYGAAPLSTYVGAHQEAWKVGMRYGLNAWANILPLIEKQKTAENVLIVGHEVFLQLIILAIMGKQGCHSQALISGGNEVITSVLKECEGFRVQLCGRDNIVLSIQKI